MCYTTMRDQQACTLSRYAVSVLVLEDAAKLPNGFLARQQRE